MKIFRAIKAGIIVWLLVFSTFLILSYVPGIKDSEIQQYIIVILALIIFSYIGATFYYQKGDTSNSLLVSSFMVVTILTLDAIFTVPFTMNGDYSKFYTSLILWVLVTENIIITYFYWRFKVKSGSIPKY